MDYNPAVISYEQLLEAFWSGHNPVYSAGSNQYRSVIFYISEEQQKLAVESKEKEEAMQRKPVFTGIEALTQFYPAEDYHQKYYLRDRPELSREMSAIYPNPQDFMNSTAVARLNGYSAGYGSEDLLQKQIGQLGLSESGQKRLLDFADFGLLPGCPVR